MTAVSRPPVTELWVIREPGMETPWVATWSRETAEGARAAGWEVKDVGWMEDRLSVFATGQHVDKTGMRWAREALGLGEE